MKKILSLLGSIALIGTTASLAVSCSSKTNDDKTSDIIIIDGSTTITVNDIAKWIKNHKAIGDTDVAIKFKMIEIISKLATGELKPVTGKEFYAAKDSQKRFTKIFNEIKIAMNNNLTNFEKDYKDKKTSDLIKALQDKTNSSSEDRTFLENQFKLSFLMNDGDNSVLTRMKDELQKENMQRIDYKETDTSWADTQYKQVLSNSQSWLMDQYFKDERPVAVSDIVVPIGDKTVDTISLNNILKPGDQTPIKYLNFILGLNKLLTNLNTDGKLDNKEITTLNDRWTEITKTTSTGTGATAGNGQLNLDLFGTDSKLGQYWGVVPGEELSATSPSFSISQKLVTLSSATTDVSTVGKMAIYDSIHHNEDANTSPITSDTTVNGTDDNALRSWLVSNGNMSSSDAQKVTDNINALNITDLRTNFIDAIKNISGFVKSISQHTENGDTTSLNNNIYTVVAGNDKIHNSSPIISYIDTNGLHFTRVEGRDLFTKNTIDRATTTTDITRYQNQYDDIVAWMQETAVVNPGGKNGIYQRSLNLKYDIDLSFNFLASIGSFQSGVGQGTNLTGVKNSTNGTIANFRDSIKGYNNNVDNNYEQFLLNTSLYNSLYQADSSKGTFDTNKTSYYGWNVEKNLETITTGTNANYWLLSYFDDVYGNVSTIVSGLNKQLETVLKQKEELAQNESKINFNKDLSEWVVTTRNAYNKINDNQLIKQFTPNTTLSESLTDFFSGNSIWTPTTSINLTILNISYKIDEEKYNLRKLSKGGVK